MDGTRPDLTILVCTFNRATLLLTCLHHLTKQTLDSARYEIIIIDNNSTDETELMSSRFIQEHPQFSIHYAKEPNQGLSYARNHGLSLAKGNYLAYLDDDALAVPEWASLILTRFTTLDPQPLGIGGPAEPFFESEQPRWFPLELERRTWGNKPGYITGSREKYGFGGLNMALPKSVLEIYGGFSTDLGVIGNRIRMGEETDLFYKIWCDHPERRGSLFWYEPGASVVHFTPVRNLQPGYRFERALRSGESNALIEHSTPGTGRFWRMIGFLLKSSLLYPLHLLIDSGPLKCRWLLRTVPLYYAVGYLKGSFLILNE